jgi:nucleoside-diphosphate-sugar epimerase
MKVLVTGSVGLIGRWTCAALTSQGHEVVGYDLCRPLPDRAYARHHVGNLMDGPGLRRILMGEKPDAVVHLAARTDLDETKDLNGYASNIEGVRNLLEAVRATPSVRRSVITSSQLVCRVGHLPASMGEYCPSTLYGQSKVMTERITRESDGGGREWVLVRPTTVWGPHMGPHYQRLLQLIRSGRYFHCGAGSLLKSYAYVENIAWQYTRILIAPAREVHSRTFYLADYEPLSLKAYADALAEGLKARPIPTYPLPIVRFLARAGDLINAIGWRRFPFNSFRLRNILTEYVFDLRATEAVCGPLPHRWEQGVKATCRWYLKSTACS